MDIFIVTEGSYSDYHIVGAFTKKDNAEEFAELIAGQVEEMETDVPYEDPGLDYFLVEMQKDGTASCNKYQRLNCAGARNVGSVSLRTNKNYPGALSKAYSNANYWVLQWQDYAKSREHAIRSANELRRQILAGQRPASVDFGNN